MDLTHLEGKASFPSVSGCLKRSSPEGRNRTGCGSRPRFDPQIEKRDRKNERNWGPKREAQEAEKADTYGSGELLTAYMHEVKSGLTR